MDVPLHNSRIKFSWSRLARAHTRSVAKMNNISWYESNHKLALIPGSCAGRERGNLVHTVCIRIFLGVCKISFVTLLNFVSHLILQSDTCHLYFGNYYSSTSTQPCETNANSWLGTFVKMHALQHSTMQDKI